MLRKILKRLTIPDKVLISGLLLLTLTSVYYLRAANSATILEIYVDNELLSTHDLEQNRIITIREGITAEIAGGSVRMLESTCRDQICVRQGLSRRLPVICAPEKIALIIKRKQDLDIMITR